jgi:uncharacterized membrane protein YbhN (UPF0104 family)
MTSSLTQTLGVLVDLIPWAIVLAIAVAAVAEPAVALRRRFAGRPVRRQAVRARAHPQR